MKNFLRRSKLLLSIPLIFILSSCGGGGSSGGGAGGSTPNVVSTPVVPSNVVSLSINQVSPSSLDMVAYEAELLPRQTLHITASGDVSVLNGQTLYVIVEDPLQLFEKNADIALDAKNKIADIVLKGKSRLLTMTDSAKSQLRIYACLDPQCQTQLGNSPLSIPYSLTVKRGLTLEKNEIVINAPFGQVPAEQKIAVQLPEGASEYSIENIPSKYDLFFNSLGNNGAFIPILPADAPYGNTRLDRRTLPYISIGGPAMLLTPGTYIQEYAIRTNNSSHDFLQRLKVTYTVASNNSLQYAFSPSNLTIKVQPWMYHSKLAGFDFYSAIPAPFKAVAQIGSLDFQRIEYLNAEAPSSAKDNYRYNNWFEYANFIWSGSSDFKPPAVVETCPNDCLPAGTYTARLKYTHTLNGTSTDVYYPITMIIEP